ncbi:MAG: trimeric intracellular cation channel family protein [Rickettsiales bacterium]|jgi:uncharacterized membrane protein YeiH|nr:trimeric intracellular cation channel family protein [Rickettsiales bacterium]
MDFISIVDYIGVAAFAATGVLKGIKHRLDVFGLLTLAVFTALGGGLIRDAILGVQPPKAFLNHAYWWIILATAAITLALYKKKFIKSDSLSLNIADAVGLGAFTFIGCKLAYLSGMGTAGVIFCGILTAVGGGVVRDLLVREIPAVLHQSVYATAALAGALSYAALYRFFPGTPVLAGAVITFSVVFIIRMMAIFNKWQLPKL